MLIIFRWTLRIFIASVSLTICAALVAYLLISRSLPSYNAEFVIDGIDDLVEVVRDENNIPHIFGSSNEDVFFGLGFVHAQDRLWQMTVLRRTAQGRLSEQFGIRTLNADKFIRSLDLYGLAAASVEDQDAEAMTFLNAYARGVNAWVDIVNRNGLGRGAPEFLLFPAPVAPWQPVDSIAILNLQAVSLSTHLDQEILRERLARVLPVEKFESLFPGETDSKSQTTFDDPANARTENRLPSKENNVDLLDPVRSRGFGGASNAWAIAANRTAAGGALLANDPHLSFSAPSIWMLARLELADGGVIGATIPGMPVVVAGRTDKIAWGVTSSYLDDQDVFIESLHPKDKTRYLTPKGFKEFKSREGKILVKGEQPVRFETRWTENGLVLTGLQPQFDGITPAGSVLSLSWTLFDPDNTTMSAAIRLMNSKSVGEAVLAGSLFRSPPLVLTLAEKNNIAMKLVGAMPQRHRRHETLGRTPSDGWKPVNRWLGLKPYSENPALTNPESGILATTNNKLVDRPFPDHVSFDWGDTQRISRLLTKLENQHTHSRESVVETQLDTISYTARVLVPLFARNLWHLAGSRAGNASMKANVLEMLRNWTGEMSEHRAEPLIFSAWTRKLFELIARDELGSLYTEFRHPDPVFLERVFLNRNGAGAWCDLIHSQKTESCSDLAEIALDEVLGELSSRYGTNPNRWRWGNLHEAAHDHPALGRLPPLSWIVNIRQSTSGGDNTINRGLTQGGGTNPFMNIHGPGYRGVYDFSDPDSSLFIISTGQSGHPLSRFYDDLGRLWRRGEYIPMTLDSELARAAPVGITKLLPIEN
ncbi:MAG: penicillin acylase family protein [Albidovulum sp.]|nr:penicillin acylase family protein [Albidovulum sp.]MDE0532338.1 penicillin acylase family protein [Albidovulum sp.]